jgi:hypothetical protein
MIFGRKEQRKKNIASILDGIKKRKNMDETANLFAAYTIEI